MSNAIPPNPKPPVVTSDSLYGLSIREIMDHLSTRCPFLFVSRSTNGVDGLSMQAASENDSAYLFGVLTAHYHARMTGLISAINSETAQKGTCGWK